MYELLGLEKKITEGDHEYPLTTEKLVGMGIEFR